MNNITFNKERLESISSKDRNNARLLTLNNCTNIIIVGAHSKKKINGDWQRGKEILFTYNMILCTENSMGQRNIIGVKVLILYAANPVSIPVITYGPPSTARWPLSIEPGKSLSIIES